MDYKGLVEAFWNTHFFFLFPSYQRSYELSFYTFQIARIGS